MTSKFLTCAATAAALAFSIAVPAEAAVVVVNADENFIVVDEVVGVGNFLTDTYQAATNLTLEFTDLFVVGDTYSVFKNGAFQFDATNFTPGAANESDPLTALNSGLFTNGSLSLMAGDIVSFQILSIPAGFTDSTIAVRGVAAVPEPATWAFMIFGFGAIGGAMRRQRKANVKVSYA